jgi:aminomethyltransferase
LGTETIRSTPLAAVAELDHPTWVEFGGFRMPVQFQGIVAEHLAVRHKAGLFDISHMGRLEMRGSGADAAVEKLVTRRTADMTLGAIRYSFIADSSGNILDDLMVARREGSWQLIVNAANRQKVVDHIHRTGFGELLTDLTFETAMLALQGPQAVELLAKIWPAAETASRKAYRLWTANRTAATLVGSRSGYTGEDGFEIYGSAAAIETLWTDLRSAGAAPCGLGARDSLRNEAALPLYGHDLRAESSPWEIGLAYAVSLDKDFIGREALAARQAAGIQRKRAGLLLTGRQIARDNMTVYLAGREVGTVTSGTWSPGRERPIAQAFLEASAAEAGSQVEIDIRGRRAQAEVVPLKSLMPPK